MAGKFISRGFRGRRSGMLVAHDARTGAVLWEAPIAPAPAAPTTHELDGRQYVAVAAGPNILCFGL